jgi:ribosomal protein S14
MVKQPDPSKVLPSPNWTIEDGVSYSLLSKFMACRERFRKYAVEGLREIGKQQKALDFGTYFHKLLEIHAKDQRLSASSVIAKVTKSKTSIKSISTFDRSMANMLFEEYLLWYSDIKYNYIEAEYKFDVNYYLPGIGNIRLRGKSDELIRWADGKIWVQENKTKENISEGILDATIPFNLQTLMYVIGVHTQLKKPMGGVVYNVIRKPKHRPKGKESEVECVERVRSELKKNPKHFFFRWEYPLPPSRLQDFKTKTFDPLLRSFYIWWKSIEHSPFDPWVLADGTPNPHHYQQPFGVYMPSTNDVGDYFNLIARNNRLGLSDGHKPFEELEN